MVRVDQVNLSLNGQRIFEEERPTDNKPVVGTPRVSIGQPLVGVSSLPNFDPVWERRVRNDIHKSILGAGFVGVGLAIADPLLLFDAREFRVSELGCVPVVR